MKPTDELKTDHRAIERMLRVLELAAQRLTAGKDVPTSLFSDALDFLRNFADKCHHGKEETHLFPTMERAGVPRQGGPIGVMLIEHDQGRALIASMADATARLEKGDLAARQPLAEAARGYVELLRNHIYKEDNILFSMADSVLSPNDQAGLEKAFADVEQTVMGPGVHERYHAMLDEMESTAARW